MSQGRRGPEHPTYTTTTGHTVQVRRLSPDTPARAQQAAMKELESTRPPVPTARTAVGEDPRTRQPLAEDVPNPSDPAYVAAFAVWERAVRLRAAEKLRTILEDYAVLTEVDPEAVAALRAVHAAIGDPLDAETETQVWLWRIVAPTTEDQTGLMAFVLGRSTPTPEAVEAQKATFRGSPPAA